MSELPLVTVSLVTYRPGHWLKPCLDSLFAQTYPQLEIIVVDNGGDAETAHALQSSIRGRVDTKVVFSEENEGYARAHNRAIASSRGQFVCLLNQDMVLDRDFLVAAVAAFDAPDIGSVQGRLRWLSPDLRLTHRIDTTGLSISRNRRIVSRGQGSSDGPHNNTPDLIFGVDGACPVYRRAALEDVRLTVGLREEYLDEDFFMYKEDVDLAWRLLLRGWKARYEPMALAWHARGAGESAAKTLWQTVQHRRRIPSRVKRLSWRNQRLMQVKNEDGGMVLRDALRIVARELASFTYLVASDPRNVVAVFDLFRLLPSARRKRRQVQRLRSVSRTELESWFT
jgi:Predicted glycosyltransferases